jgi:hypothetical protein
MSHTGKWVDTSSLSGVFGQVGVDKVDNIRSNWRLEDTWKWDLSGASIWVGEVVDSYSWNSGHYEVK